MTTLQLVVLAWAFAALLVCVFMYGAFRKDGGKKSKRDAALAKEWQDRLFSRNV